MLDSLHHKDFAPHINTKFQVQLDENATIEIELISAEEKPSSPRQEQFVLIFRAPHDAPPQQRLYQLQHEQLGSGRLFLVPIERDEEGLIYEAVFNRRLKVEQR